MNSDAVSTALELTNDLIQFMHSTKQEGSPKEANTEDLDVLQEQEDLLQQDKGKDSSLGRRNSFEEIMKQGGGGPSTHFM